MRYKKVQYSIPLSLNLKSGLQILNFAMPLRFIKYRNNRVKSLQASLL